MIINNVELKWLRHASFLIKSGQEKIIYVDPYNITDNEKADIILITHPHYDHCSLQDIEKIVKDNTIIVIPADCQSKIARLEHIDMRIIEAGQTIDLGGIKIGAVPAYNLDKEFHSKTEGWLGYVVKIGRMIIYHAGDTDMIPEMEKLSVHSEGNEFIALLPVGGTYTMNAEEAAEVAASIRPSLAVPMHFGSVAGRREDAEKFVNLCEEKGIRAEILEEN